MRKSKTNDGRSSESSRCSTGGVGADVKAFKQEAGRLFNKEILWRWKESDNVWRNAWAMDTLLDYFEVCDIDASSYGETALNVLNPTKAVNWWDDFGWIGIAALRAAEQNIFPDHRDDFLKIAVNAWAYMYGPGWSKNNTYIYPFTDVPGWKQFADKHTSNVGAPNVWKDIEQTWPGITEDQKMERKPRYSPGGAWNSTITGEKNPHIVRGYDGTGNYLNPIQNTVTNGLYAILTLRVYQASQNPIFGKVFSEAKLDSNACLQSWKNQINWFDQWMVGTTDADESLLLRLDEGSLARERVSTFHTWDGWMYWDAAYRKDLVWTGDQGLLLGALRESRAAGLLDPEPKVLGLYPDIVEGVFKNGYKRRTYGKVEGSFLLPWIVIGSNDPYKASSPGGDDGDYQTGNGVFMRYLLQAYKADQTLVEKYKDNIVNSAEDIISKEFGPNVEPEGGCDAFTPLRDDQAVNQMTAYVNRLSVLLPAIVMSD